MTSAFNRDKKIGQTAIFTHFTANYSVYFSTAFSGWRNEMESQ